MEFSAFLAAGMSKENEKISLKTVDEVEKANSRVVRLHEDTVEEVDSEPPRVGVKMGPEARLEAASRAEMKIRSSEPDVGSLIEVPEVRFENEWETPNPSKRLPWGWLVLIAGVFAAGIIWSLKEVGSAEERDVSLKINAKSVLDREIEEDLSAEQTIQTIEEAARNFYDSRSIEELLKYVRHPERVKPLMEDYYARHPLVPSRVEQLRSMNPLTIDHFANFWVVGSIIKSGEANQLLVEAMNSREAKVDWETYVCYQPMEWDEFVTGRQEGYTGDFRVYVEGDHFYAHEFADSDKYISFRLSVRDSDEYLFGYVLKTQTFAKRFEEFIIASNGKPAPMLLRLHIPKNAQSKRGVLVEELVATRWLLIDSSEAKE